MDSKNVIAAISLSAAVIILYSLFFAPNPEELKQNQIKKEAQIKKAMALKTQKRLSQRPMLLDGIELADLGGKYHA